MRGLDPRIHALTAKEDVDGRIKSGHDEIKIRIKNPKTKQGD